MTRFLSTAVVAGLIAAACSSGSAPGGGNDNSNDIADDDGGGGPIVGEGDPAAIAIEVTSPERGTVSSASEVTVAGRVTAAAGTIISGVTVNGAAAQLAGDGTFQLSLPLTEGIALIETVASDSAGNQAIDARGILAGTLVDQASPVAQGVVANLSGAAIAGLSTMISDLANDTDFTALVQSSNPVVDTGDGCNTAKVFVDSVQHSGVDVQLAPVAGGIGVQVVIHSLVVTGQVQYRVGVGPACGDFSADFTMTADAANIGGAIIPQLAGGDIEVVLQGVTSTLDGFQIDVAGVPGFIEDLFTGTVRDRLAEILRDNIAEMVPPLANSFLSDFLSGAFTLSVLGQTVSFGVAPSAMSWTEQGGTIVLDTTATVDGTDGAVYLSTPRPRPSDADLASDGLRIAIADDVLDQLLAGLWSSGALEDTLLPVPGDALSAVFGGDVASAALTPLLPPVASFDTTTGTAHLTLGDLLVEATSPAGEILASFVISAEIELAAQTSSDGRVTLITSTPRILAQILSQSDSLLAPLTTDKVAAIAELAIGQLSNVADDLLASIPIPGLPGLSLTSPTLQPAGGYLLLGGTITAE